MRMESCNLFSALRRIQRTLPQTAIEAASPDGAPLYHTWRDLDQASARIANLLASL